MRDERRPVLARADRLAFEALYELHHSGILSFCRHMLRCAQDAEDAAQQTFLSAYEHLLVGDRPTHPRAWLFTIARNHCLMTLRRRGRTRSPQVAPGSSEPADEIDKRSDLARLVTDLLDLPEDQRMALVLFELGDLSHADIARILRCSPARVKSLVFQARRALLANRQAWETPCREIREQLLADRGRAPSGSILKRHLGRCRGCAEFRAEVKRRRQATSVALPTIPALGIRQKLLSAIAVTSQTGSLGGAAAVLSQGAKLKLAILATALTGATLRPPVATSPDSSVSPAGSAAAHGDGRGFQRAPAMLRLPGVTPQRSYVTQRLAGPAVVVGNPPAGGSGAAGRTLGRGPSIVNERGKGHTGPDHTTIPGQRGARRVGPGRERRSADDEPRDQPFAEARGQSSPPASRPGRAGKSAPSKPKSPPSVAALELPVPQTGRKRSADPSGPGNRAIPATPQHPTRDVLRSRMQSFGVQ